MTALAAERITPQWAPDAVFMYEVPVPVAASTKIYAGAMVDINASGYAVPAATNTTGTAAGRCEATVDNSAGADGALVARVRRGVFKWSNSASGDLIAQADTFKDCYVVDDNTVAKTSNSSARHKAGKVMGVDTDGGVWVQTVFY